MAIAGIGNPNNFFQLLKENGLNIEKQLIFPDHYEFSNTEISKLIEEADKNNYQILMTEKDYFKVKDMSHNNIKYLKVSLDINEKEKFLNEITKLYAQNN